MKSKEQFVSSIVPGNIIAFKNGEFMYSGKVIDCREENKAFVVRTKNGSIYEIARESVAWVKNGTNWPVGIYNALKYSKGVKQ